MAAGEIKLSRWKLYAQVWETPISRLAADLGISDTGLRKACLRHDIPVPARGHWARLSAGQKVGAPPLPRPGDDDVVWLMPAGPRQRLNVPEVAEPADGAGPIAVPGTLDGCHPLVAKTARYFAKAQAEIERQQKRRLNPASEPNWRVHPRLNLPQFHVGPLINGRLSSLGEGRLHIVATLREIDWILRFHEALIRSLRAHGFRVIPREGNEADKVQVAGHGGILTMSFMEEFERRSKPGLSAYSSGWVAKNSFKLQFHVPATQSPKTFQGDKAQLERVLTEIAPRVSRWLAEQAERERLRLLEEEEKKKAAATRKVEMDAWFAERDQAHKRQEFERKRSASRQAQAGRLLEATKAQAEYLLAVEWLKTIKAQAGDDAAVRAWITVVREGQTEPFASLLKAIRDEAGQVEKPLWWPDLPPSP